jgi:hypothetical protein
MNVWKQSVHRLYEALQNPHVELRVNCYSHVQRYTKCYIIRNFSKPRVDLWTLYMLVTQKLWMIKKCFQYYNQHEGNYLDHLITCMRKTLWGSAMKSI